MQDQVFAYDIESFSNYFCAILYCGETKLEARYEYKNGLGALIDAITQKHIVLVGYNNFNYDDLLLRYIVDNPNATPAEINAVSKRIVISERMPDDLFKKQYEPFPWKHSIDMFQVLNKKGGLKEWQCREHYKIVQDSPVNFDAPLPTDKIAETLNYCANDARSTWMLYEKYKHLVDLRSKLIGLFDLGPRLHAVGDAGVAKQYFLSKYKERTGGYSSTARKGAEDSQDNKAREWPTKEIVSPRVRFTTPEFKEFYDDFCNQILVGDGPGTTWGYLSDRYQKPVRLGNTDYQIGVGGLHSVDAPGRFVATGDVAIYDLDVTSYYPSLMIVENLYPKHIGPKFIEDFTLIRDLRVKAKRAGDKQVADALKIVANASFGILNEFHSPVRSIPSALRVTINGQLQLLMLIEMLCVQDARILSANTDGVTFMMPKADRPIVERIMATWGKQTGHTLELGEYKVYARRDVNNYVALGESEKIKAKGAFELSPVGGKTDRRVVKVAAQSYLLLGTPIRETVEKTKDIRDFVFYQRAKNGGDLYYGDELIGRTARWYAGVAGKQIRRKNPNGIFAKLPDGDNAVLMMILPESIPDDLCREYYIRQAVELVESITKRPKEAHAKDMRSRAQRDHG